MKALSVLWAIVQEGAAVVIAYSLVTTSTPGFEVHVISLLVILYAAITSDLRGVQFMQSKFQVDLLSALLETRLQLSKVDKGDEKAIQEIIDKAGKATDDALVPQFIHLIGSLLLILIGLIGVIS